MERIAEGTYLEPDADIRVCTCNGHLLRNYKIADIDEIIQDNKYDLERDIILHWLQFGTTLICLMS